MTREEFIKQRCEIDKITEEEFEKRYRVVKCNCGQPYCKGYRCLDLDGLLKENQELKKQFEEYQLQNVDLRADIMIQKMAFPNELIKDKTFYDLYDIPSYEELLVQQKEFIKYLENMLDDENDIFSVIRVKDALQKYREIIGVER